MMGNHEITGCGKGGRVFWGILFLSGAVAFLVNRLDVWDGLEGISFWSILFTIGLAACLVNSLIRGSWGGILFSLAFLVIVNDKLLNLEEITPWPVLGAALLGTIGLNLLFPKFRRVKSYKLLAGGEHVVGDAVSGDKVFYENAFGSAVKYVTGEVSRVRLDNAFGSMEVYFTDAVLKDHSATVNVDSSFGRVVLYVPRNWQVINNTTSSFASDAVNDTAGNRESSPSAEDTLYLSGEVAFGALVVRYV